ncbi:iron-containing redox enzyme family protein [Pseudoalteromonas sp. KG3]|uniref:Iron-containing redox enzyme family protein n=1 Tax=Pseudoalteromonas prydzensis TaxID=182141 RepID=A0ABR9FMQ3_9GAMM|nr:MULTISPECIES: iron-containing redox enzyme family protein [Pseudoalteromonas]MBE0458118.1 iron-containing redox enzyme family protein [Pseudoalteromonas prydzensis]WKD22432.1 iron-containing redox enzyme family protein [Pseudoalteromonas sp. KG3]
MEQFIQTDLGKKCLHELLNTWLDFDKNLSKVPIIKRLETGKLSQEDYRELLLNMRQQVIEGSRWISRSASSFDRHYSDVRSAVIHHAYDEHQDYLMIEQDYVAAGGLLSDIQAGTKNIGSEALHGYLMYTASLPNPVSLIGAMWIIEGLGNKMSLKWAKLINEYFDPPSTITRFLEYHGQNDADHLKELYQLIDRVTSSEEQIDAIVKTAKVVGRLYCLQLEEVDHNE